ncbi:hypothetical protein [Raineyella sp. LH-20]|uniref:hypothetical protein n=1 Tax=Raineyella sp. LH-20 TaxID=3081204 RepID=UPI0029541F40|nr:hypothetical protein [Raineyella sp. LH-20]WOP20082.1 hypothetical protein R0146_07350 [Raineyella sp. LH-20]
MTFRYSQPYGVVVEIGSSGAWLAERGPGPDGAPPRAVELEPVAYGPDDEFLIGPAAREQGIQDPTTCIASYLSRIGDDLPLLLAGRATAPEDLLALVLCRRIDEVTECHGGASAEEIVVVLPAEWGPHRRSLVRDALARQQVTPLRLAAAPIAALLDPRLDLPTDTRTALVVDGGDRRISATVVHRVLTEDIAAASGSAGTPELPDADRQEIWGWRVQEATGEEFGGRDIDDALLGFVQERLGAAPLPADGAALRRACRTAREELSVAPAVMLTPPGRSEPLRLVRAELDLLVGGLLRTAISALLLRLDVRPAGGGPGTGDHVPGAAVAAAAADGAAVDGGVAVDAVVLCGGLAQMPLLVEMVSELTGRPVLVATEASQAAIRGAALASTVVPAEGDTSSVTTFVMVPDTPDGVGINGMSEGPGRSDEATAMGDIAMGDTASPAAVGPRRRRRSLGRYSGLAAGVAVVALAVSAPLSLPGLAGGLADLIAGNPAGTADAAESRSAPAGGLLGSLVAEADPGAPRGPLETLADLLIPDAVAATLAKDPAADPTQTPSPLRSLAERLLPGADPTTQDPGSPASTGDGNGTPSGPGTPASAEPTTPPTETPSSPSSGGGTTPTQQPEPTDPAPGTGGGPSTAPSDPAPTTDPALPSSDPAPSGPVPDPAPPAPTSDPVPQSVAPSSVQSSATEV